ncbi:MAG: hypothetical protein PUD53_07120 [Oscillospiraceae bacterium]|nr:hypothetical protein [Oscillospiraceae bacterium]
MNITGKWKVKKIGVLQPDFSLKMYTPQELETLEDAEEYIKIAGSIIEFLPDGTMNTLLPVPKELESQLIAEGKKIVDGFGIMDTTTWKEENGEYFYDTKIEGEIFGEKVSSFEKLEIEDDCILYSQMLLEKNN